MATQIKGPKPQRFTFNAQCMTKDHQVVKVTVCVNYLSAVRQDDWMYARFKDKLQTAVDDHVVDRLQYDVTTDRNPPKALVATMSTLVKEGLRLAPKPAPTIKLDEVLVTIRRDR